MKETIYLKITAQGITGMTKNLPRLERDEYPLKLIIEIPPGSFRKPVVERSIVVEDWAQGTDLSDITLRQDIITQAEADMIVQRRLAQMQAIMKEHGYLVIAPGEQPEEQEPGQ